MVQSVSSFTFLFSEIATKTLENLLNSFLINGFRAIIIEFAVNVELDQNNLQEFDGLVGGILLLGVLLGWLLVVVLFLLFLFLFF